MDEELELQRGDICVSCAILNLPWLQNYRHRKNHLLHDHATWYHHTKWIYKITRVSSQNASNNFTNMPRRITDRPNHSYTLLAARSMNPKYWNSSLTSFVARASRWAMQCISTRWDTRSWNQATTLWCTSVLYAVPFVTMATNFRRSNPRFSSNFLMN